MAGRARRAQAEPAGRARHDRPGRPHAASSSSSCPSSGPAATTRPPWPTTPARRPSRATVRGASAWPRRRGPRPCGSWPGSVPELGDDGRALQHGPGLQPARRTGGLAPQGPPLPTDRGTGHLPSRRPPHHLQRSDARGGRRGHLLRRGLPRGGPDAWRLRGARLVVAPSAYEVEGATTWDVLYPALALANSQWWIQSNQCGAHGTTTLLGASRIVAPTGHGGGRGDPGRPRLHASARTARPAHRPPAGLPEGRHRHPARRGPSAAALSRRVDGASRAPRSAARSSRVGPPSPVVGDVHRVVEGHRLAEEPGDHEPPSTSSTEPISHRRTGRGPRNRRNPAGDSSQTSDRDRLPHPHRRGRSPGLAGTVSRAKSR